MRTLQTRPVPAPVDIGPDQTYAALSLFSGAGGLDLGAEQTGRVKTVLAVDQDRWATETYRQNLGPHVWTAGVGEYDLPEIEYDILLAGPPCQEYSTAGPRRGVLTERGRLFETVAAELEFYRPKAFVVENVVGTLSANDGHAYRDLRRALKNPGVYFQKPGGPGYELAVRVVNFADLGVPQNRQRLIIVGIRRDLQLRLGPMEKPFRHRHMTVSDALDTNPLGPDAANHAYAREGEDVIERLKLIAPGQNASAIPAGHRLSVGGKMSNNYRREKGDQPAYTVMANGGGGSYSYHHRDLRRNTSREQARFQTFPDDFRFAHPGRPDRYSQVARRQIGNAVPPLAAAFLVNELTDVLARAGIFGIGDKAIAAQRQKAIEVGLELGVTRDLQPAQQFLF